MNESPLDRINRLLDAVEHGECAARGGDAELAAWIDFGKHGPLWQLLHRKPSRKATTRRWPR